MIQSLLHQALDGRRERLTPESRVCFQYIRWATGCRGLLDLESGDDVFVRMLAQIVKLNTPVEQHERSMPLLSFDNESKIQEEVAMSCEENSDEEEIEVCPQTGIPVAAFERVGRELYRRSQQDFQPAAVIEGYFK